MTRHQQIKLLLQVIKEDFTNISDLFRKSVKNRRLEEHLLVRIKNSLENLKSVLDFSAQEVFDRYCVSTKPINVYFPVLQPHATDSDIIARINGNFPGLEQNAPELFGYFSSIQPARDINNEWLSILHNLCNQNKHVLLTLQVRKDEIINVLTVKNSRTYIWSDGLVQFHEKNQKVVIPPGGIYQIVNSEDPDQTEDFWTRGWILDKLENYKQRSLPDLSELSKDSYTLDSYSIGNYYFDNTHMGAYTLLTLFVTKVEEIHERLCSFL